MNRRYILWVLVLSLIGCILCDCNKQNVEETEPSGPIEMWIVTEKTADYRMNGLIAQVRSTFKKANKEVKTITQKIPVKSEERAVYLENLRTQIMAGDGPDIFLFSTSRGTEEQLFTDVTQTMHNGIFMDISTYYDADTELNKDGFVSAVMNTGVLDGARYVLPLRWNIPVIYADVRQLEEAGQNVDVLSNGLEGLTEAVQTMGRQSLAADISFMQTYMLNLLSAPVNHENQTVHVPQEDLAVFLNTYRNLMNAIGGVEIPWAAPDFGTYISHGEFWALDGYSMYLGSLDELVYNVRLAKASDVELAVLPLKALDGSVIADVTYYGAVSANCDDPELAYEFLRGFLLEESQWENNIQNRTIGLIASGWPVLTEGSWSDLNGDLFRQVTGDKYADEAMNTRKRTIQFAELTEEEFDILNTEISDSWFPFSNGADYFEEIDSQLNPYRNPDAMNVDAEELAEELIFDLEWHLAEG